jgi:hypothetical protein
MDNSWDYKNGNGQGEIKMGKALRDGYRQKVLLMTNAVVKTFQPLIRGPAFREESPVVGVGTARFYRLNSQSQ